MISYEDIEIKLKQSKPYLIQQFKVKEIGVFGSYAAGEESEESDVDILVEFCENIGWEFFDLKEYLEELLDKKVDLVTVRAIKRQLKDTIINEVNYV